jgi:hypothetical protein|tara:strand:- start:41 stop:208 length:168 start_codon:yes stop_codon:yes gene_type:complete
MAQQNTGGFGVAHPVQYSPDKIDIKDPPDTLPSDFQPPGVDEEVDYNSLEEALVS